MQVTVHVWRLERRGAVGEGLEMKEPQQEAAVPAGLEHYVAGVRRVAPGE